MPNIFENYDIVFFDLDDTLYPEMAYLKAAFEGVGHFFEKEYSLNAQKVEEYLTTTFTKHGRKNLFNQCFNHFEEEIHQNTEGVLSEKIFINLCLHILRTVKIGKKIDLFPYAYVVIPQLLKENKQIYVLTNGNVSQQKNKINSLNWTDFADSIIFVFANEFAPKPSSKVFTDFLDPHFKLKNKTMLFIGDAQTDAQFCQNIGIDFLHVDFF